MPGAREEYLGGLLEYAKDFDTGTREVLRGTLFDLWEEFTEEYAGVSVSDLDVRFTKFLLIESAVTSESPAP
jgi:hypothetical protein